MRSAGCVATVDERREEGDGLEAVLVAERVLRVPAGVATWEILLTPVSRIRELTRQILRDAKAAINNEIIDVATRESVRRRHVKLKYIVSDFTMSD